MASLKTSTAHAHFVEVFGVDEGLRKLKECGFDGVDYSFHAFQDDEDYFMLKGENEVKKFCLQQKAVMDDIGLEVAQTHAPYYMCDPSFYESEKFAQRFINAIKGTYYIGGKYVVIHPPRYPDPENTMKKTLELNLKFYGMLKQCALDYGVTIAVENLCALHPVKKTGVPSSDSSAEKLSNIIDGMGEGFCACLDTGHTFFCGMNPADQARLLGNRLKVLHLQDNDGTDDMHIAPTFGNIDWHDFVKALKEINYTGYINTEVNFLRSGGKDTIMAYGRFLNRISRDFAAAIEKN